MIGFLFVLGQESNAAGAIEHRGGVDKFVKRQILVTDSPWRYHEKCITLVVLFSWHCLQ